MKPNLERRTFSIDEVAVTRTEKERPMIVGHAAVFNQEADLGLFREKIMPGAFARSIAHDDIRALVNHSPMFVLGRNRSGTLRLREDEKGLRVEIDPPDTQWARDLMVSIERRDLSQMSFGFLVPRGGVEWGNSGGNSLRTVKQAELMDVSIATFPMYPGAEVSLRTAEQIFAEYTEESIQAEQEKSAPGVDSLEPHFARLERAQKDSFSGGR